VDAELSIDRRAPVQRAQLDESSWVDLVPGFVRQPEPAFEEVRRAVTWRQSEVLRYERYVPERRLVGWIPPDATATPTLVRHTHLHLRASYRQALDGAAAILYRNGNDFQGLHSDREMRWLDHTLIAIVVLGVRRPFVFRPRGPWTARHEVDTRHDVVLMPGEGDLLVMGGACQRDWLHGVPESSTDRERISLTWRWTSRRGRPDTAPGYFEGRQFSDRPRQPGTRLAP